MYILEVYVTNSSLNVNQLYSYKCDYYVEPFKRVEIIFARNNNKGIVITCNRVDDMEAKEKELGFKISRIIDVLDDEPIINDEQYQLAKWLSKTTISPFISCLNTMLPKALRTNKKESKPVLNEYIRILNSNYKFTKKQKEIFDSLYDGMLASEARKLSTSIIKKFIDNEIIQTYKEEKKYQDRVLDINNNFKTLTNDQSIVYNKILDTEKLISLLFGVTGSGKTEVYLHLARDYIKQGKEVLILVPEISLTPQMINRVKERFNDVIFYHSELNDQERYEQYQRVKKGEIKIVVGTRSSIFLPFNNLGLIIIDEEHDSSYKQDSTPCYNVKSVAIKRALSFSAKILLASATPSLDSYTRALKGEYELLELKERINNKLPEIEIVDLTNEVKHKKSYIISSRLKEEIEYTLDNNKQVIILLNRRGYSPIIKCGSCGTTLMCQDCDMPLNYHKDEGLLKCHQCGRTYKQTRYCPKCHEDKLVFLGYGTKRVEEELNNLFPSARIARMDHDSVSKKGGHEQILTRFENHEIDILLGTQMIAKGLDYPDVTLVGILNADAGLAHQDYNAAKLTLDLLMQASGRSGRSVEKGKVIIQAFNPDHYVLKAVLSQDYDYFYKIEMNYRSKTMYPPYSHILEIIITDKKIETINKSIKYLEDRIDSLSIKHYRPIELAKVMGNMRYRILICDKDISKMIDGMWDIMNSYLKTNGLAKIKIDIDPLYLE